MRNPEPYLWSRAGPVANLDKEVATVKIVTRLSDILERLSRRGIDEDRVLVDADALRIIPDDDDDADEDGDD